MNDLVSYIFRNMDATDKHLIHIYKALVHQNKFNNPCCECLDHGCNTQSERPVNWKENK